ncbi:hypothetical protein SAMN05444410_102145 [Hydrobacter penzbergensis]|uniref:Uncharacterized protein n=1 Tax=Hydrobacter penzbergensis TaxID=1235997 RepID=A0A8X8LD87_9BACT|nr:hypothetical protein [Hydrobacter penzbergensis]SDW37494.1 hypothetical protein SAMN05444410_102145 [Hydrobacter penzbergensis]
MKTQTKHIAVTPRNAKSRYYGLDEIGIVGTQERKSPRVEAYYAKKIGDIFRAARKTFQRSK